MLSRIETTLRYLLFALAMNLLLASILMVPQDTFADGGGGGSPPPAQPCDGSPYCPQLACTIQMPTCMNPTNCCNQTGNKTQCGGCVCQKVGPEQCGCR